MTELAEVFRSAGPEYVRRFGDRLLQSHWRALRDIVDCRTPALGGRMYLCHYCGHRHPVYCSCRNRHCPKCQGDQAELWLDRQRELLLPCSYGLATCTLPAELRVLARSHQRTVYSILLREAARALLDIVSEPRFIGGLTAVMAVLHTWTRALVYHPHVHMLFPLGALTDHDSWVKPRSQGWVFPAYALARRFRERTELAFRAAGLFHLVPASVWRRRWVAHVKPVGAGDTALLYLSRYVFRVALSNHRILSLDGAKVTLSAKANNGGTVLHTLSALELIRRFLQHVLPRSFVKVRYYGLWAPTNRSQLETARTILEHHLVAVAGPRRPRQERNPETTAPRQPRCPRCGMPYHDPPIPIPRPRPPP